MKHVTIALMLCAIPATAFAQDVSCPDCDHVVPYFRGVGGFIGTVADGVDEVIFVASCGGVTTTGEVPVDGDTVAQLFDHRNGLACDRAGGSLEIAGLADGGWYWITDEMNSAVGSLVRKDVLDNTPTQPTDPGSDDITLTEGNGAVFVKQASTGRVGILSTILAAPRTPELRKCGFDTGGTAAAPTYSRRTSACVMGDGGTIVWATTTDPFTGSTTRVTDRASIVRPNGTASVVVIVDLWANGSGHFTTASGGEPRLGNPAVARTGARAAARLTGVTYTARLGSGPTADPLVSGTAVRGITFSDSTTNVAEITIAADSDSCSRRNNIPVTISLTASMSEADAAQVTPSVERNSTSGAVGGMSFTVVCL